MTGRRPAAGYNAWPGFLIVGAIMGYNPLPPIPNRTETPPQS